MAERCSEMVYREWGKHHQCNRNGSIERRGKWYCKQHDPVAVLARSEAKRQKFKKETDQELRKWACARALAGVKDPEAAVRAAKEALQECKEYIAANCPFPLVPPPGRRTIKRPKAWDKAHGALALLNGEE